MEDTACLHLKTYEDPDNGNNNFRSDFNNVMEALKVSDSTMALQRSLWSSISLIESWRLFNEYFLHNSTLLSSRDLVDDDVYLHMSVSWEISMSLNVEKSNWDLLVVSLHGVLTYQLHGGR